MTASGFDILGLDLGLPEPATIYPSANTYTDLTQQTCNPLNDDSHVITLRDPLMPWPAKLPLELAIGAEPQADILLRLNISEDDFCRWALMPAFRRALAEAAKEIRENGVTFKLLCGRIAEDFLPELDQKLHDPCVAFAAKLDAFKTITKLAGLEPKDVKDTGAGNQNLVQININL